MSLADLHALEAILAPLGWRKKSWGPGLWRPCRATDRVLRTQFIVPYGPPGSGFFEWYATGTLDARVGTLDELAEYVKSKEGMP